MKASNKQVSNVEESKVPVSKMQVSKILVNYGSDPNTPMETGFTNSRLPQKLGIYDDGAGKGFGWSFQITFWLDGITSGEVVPMRKVKQIIDHGLFSGRKTAAQLQQWPPTWNQDNPSHKNLKSEKNKIVIFDGPGPKQLMVVGDPSAYPILHKTWFLLELYHYEKNFLLASAEYRCEIKKDQIDGIPTGEFRIDGLSKILRRNDSTLSVRQVIYNQRRNTL